MDVCILGPLMVEDDGSELTIAGARMRTLLALFAVRPGENITAERLVDDLWGDESPAGAANSLQSLVSRLRRALGDTGSAVVTTPNGYRLDVTPDRIDAFRFVDAAQRGHEALLIGDAALATRLLNDGLTLWRGAALDGFDDDGVLHREAVRLEELRLNATEDRLDADLRLGRHADVIAELGSLVTEHPLRERLHGFLMLALYRAGRQAEALRAFQEARRVLGDELGLDPSPELRALESSILAQDPALDHVAAPTPAASAQHRTNLWRELSEFVGRATELAALSDLMGTGRLITVVGPGGAGKTRLAVEAAALEVGRCDVWFIDLAPLRSSDAVADTVAATTGLGDGVLSQGAPGLNTVERLVDHLRGRPTLLLLDNCEHVVREAARVAERLLIGCDDIRILTTSREALGVRGESVWVVPPMSSDDAVALFTNRAANASGPATSDDTIDVVTEICARLDGLPLAIELAAGRVRAIPVRQLAARLDDRFRLLTGGSRTALPRQQTLRAVVEWSHELLFDDEQRVFARLSVFAGGCSLDAAEAICSGDDIAAEDVADLLGHLVDKSLLIADHTDANEPGGEVRYRLLQTLELYGREQLTASGEAEAVRARHAEYFEALCRRGHDAFRGDRQEAWLTEVQREADNLRAVMTWLIERNEALAVQTMLGGLGWAWWFAGRGDEGWRWLTSGLACDGATAPLARATASMWAGYVGASAGVGMEAASVHAEEAVTLLRANPGQRLAAETSESLLPDALMLAAGIRGMVGDPVGATRHYTDAADLYASRDGHWNRALQLNATGRLAELAGDVRRGFELQCASVDHFEAAGVHWALAVINGDVGMIAFRLGELDEALRRTRGAAEAAQRLRLGGYQAVLLNRLAWFTLLGGDLERSDQLNTEAIDLSESVRFTSAEAFARLGRAIVRRLQGRLDEAVAEASRANRLFIATGLNNGRPQALCILGLVAQERGDLAGARQLHLDAFEVARRIEDRRCIALALEGLAGVALDDGDHALAARLLGAALAARAIDGGAPSGPESDAAAVSERLVELVGHDAHAEAMAAGQISLEQILRDGPVGEHVGDDHVVGELTEVLEPEG